MLTFGIQFEQSIFGRGLCAIISPSLEPLEKIPELQALTCIPADIGMNSEGIGANLNPHAST